MNPIALALVALLATTAVASAQTGLPPSTRPPSGSPSTVAPQSPSGTPSPTLNSQPFGTTSPINPATGLPSNEPSASPQTGLPSASPSTVPGPNPNTLPPPVWSAPSPPAGVPLPPGSR